jgi:hypothetical protein
MTGFGGGFESVGMVRHFPSELKIFFDESLSTSSGLDFAIRFSQLGEVFLLKDVGMMYRLSEGQWHTNSDELKRNTSIISSKFSSYFGEDLGATHGDYFHWIEVRKLGHLHLLHEVLKDVFNWRFSRLKMLFWLVSRNLVALLRGRVSRNLTLRHIKEMQD